MAETSFLDAVRRTRGDDYAGDQYGGAAGADGRGLPTGHSGNFMFATGIECSAPIITGPDGRPLRRDLIAETGHDVRFREDLGLVRELGLKVLRYGLPLHRIHLGPGRYDWSWADEVMAELRRLELTPILDLMHFGVPDWLGDFQNPELPVHFADYAGAVAERYPWVRHWTPVNEMYVTARLSAMDGQWNERRRDDRAFVTAVKHCVAADILATHAIARVRPDAIIVQSESAEFTHDAHAVPEAALRLRNKLRFLALDLLYAVTPDAEVGLYCLDNGLTREEYDWFMRGEPPGFAVLGVDYYGRNERIRLPDGSSCGAEDVLGWYQITREYYDRYRKPVMHTETNTFDPEQAVSWLWKQWVSVLRMRRDSVPVLGFTWYSLLDQVDWHVQLARKLGEVNACGLFDLDRRPRAVANAYRALIEEFGQITIVPHAELFEVTDREARLKVKV